jgi:hypothetical protein
MLLCEFSWKLENLLIFPSFFFNMKSVKSSFIWVVCKTQLLLFLQRMENEKFGKSYNKECIGKFINVSIIQKSLLVEKLLLFYAISYSPRQIRQKLRFLSLTFFDLNLFLQVVWHKKKQKKICIPRFSKILSQNYL